MCPHQGGHLLSTCCPPRARPGARSRAGVPAAAKGLLMLQGLQSGVWGGAGGCARLTSRLRFSREGEQCRRRARSVGMAISQGARGPQLACQQDGLRGEKGFRLLADSFVRATLPLLRAEPSPHLQEVLVPSLQGSQAEGSGSLTQLWRSARDDRPRKMGTWVGEMRSLQK